jgi:hypothetical protein
MQRFLKQPELLALRIVRLKLTVKNQQVKNGNQRRGCPWSVSVQMQAIYADAQQKGAVAKQKICSSLFCTLLFRCYFCALCRGRA